MDCFVNVGARSDAALKAPNHVNVTLLHDHHLRPVAFMLQTA